MKYIFIFNSFITIISFIVNIAFIIPFLIKGYNYFTKKRYVKKILSFTEEPVMISQSIFQLKNSEGTENDFITYRSLKSLDNVINVLKISNQNFELINLKKHTQNEVNIGGFMTNKVVNAYFTKHFNNFKYVIDVKYKSIYDKYLIDKSLVEYSNDKFGFKINDELILQVDRKTTDYAFLIKLVKKDFKDDYEKNVHILFGGVDIGTEKATEFLLTHYKQIYKKYKNNHYFFAIEINCIDESINYSKGIIDLTDKMFPK